MILLKKGSKGPLVKALQYIIGVDADGAFGKDTYNALKEYQRIHHLVADGICGEATYDCIVDNMQTLRIGSSGPYVQAVEVLLDTLTCDGLYTADEEQHVKTYQSAKGLAVDGIVGKNTMRYLLGIIDSSNIVSSTDKLKPVDYKQYDSRWGKKIYSTHNDPKQTYAASACGPTSMADLCATFIDPSITPVTMGELALKLKCRTYDNGTAWSFFKKVFETYPQFKKFIQTSSFETMRACLNDGGYAIVTFGPGSKAKWTTGG